MVKCKIYYLAKNFSNTITIISGKKKNYINEKLIFHYLIVFGVN